jgi:hypothetical protein
VIKRQIIITITIITKIRIISIKFQRHQGSRAAGGFHGHIIIIIIES